MPVKKNKPFQIPLDVPVYQPHSQTHYLAPEPVVEVAPVPELAPVVEVAEVVQEKPKKTRKVKSPVPEELELNRNYETDQEFEKNVALDFDKLFSLDFKPVKKTRKPKKVVEVITDSDSDSEPEVKQAEAEPKLKKSNAWVQHIRNFALENGIGYNKAMIHPDLKKNYIKSTGGRVSL